MIIFLSVRNFKLAEQVDLEFESGFSTLTGETGAGKSLTIDALSLLLGERASPDTIAASADKAEIQGIFQLPSDHPSRKWLMEKAMDEGDECIIRRVLSKKSGSRAFINGSAVTVQDLKSLGSLLVDIHGQHEQQLLVSPERQRVMLDAFAGLQPAVEELTVIFDELSQLQSNYDALMNRSDADRERARLLEFQIEELENLNLEAGEDERLHVDYNMLAHSQDLIHGVAETVDGLFDMDGANIARMLTQYQQTLTSLSQHDPELTGFATRLDELAIESSELASDLRRKLETYEFDPEKMNEVQLRLDQLHATARKYRVEVNDLVSLLERCVEEFKSIAGDDSTLTKLNEEISFKSAEYERLAKTISSTRCKESKSLGIAVTRELKDLGMKDAVFVIDLMPQENRRAWGKESTQFSISTNPSMQPGALSKVASGGELSRVALAINVVSNKGVPALTQIYDEVDVGVGGGVAEMIGQKLRTVSENKQVLCVTHLAQVASQAQHHKLVNKASGKTGISITTLTSDSRRLEIARMLGGIEITERTLEHAAEMLDAAGAAN